MTKDYRVMREIEKIVERWWNLELTAIAAQQEIEKVLIARQRELWEESHPAV